MAKSKLTAADWVDVDQRLQLGEAATVVAKSYGITEGAIRQHFGPLKKDKVQRVAVKILEARQAKKVLAPILQVKAESLADQLEELSKVMMNTARAQSDTALRMAQIAKAQALQIDVDNPNIEMLRDVHALIDTSNKASSQGLELLKINKGAPLPKVEEPPGIDVSRLGIDVLAKIVGARCAAE